MNWKQIRARLNKFDTDFVGEQLNENLVAAESAIGQNFPPSYRKFVAEYGCGAIDSEEIIGLGGPDHLSILKLKAVFESRSKKMPNYLLPIRADGFGNYDCIDLRKPTENDEYEIVLWNHDDPNANNHQTIARSFAIWLVGLLDMIEEDDD